MATGVHKGSLVDFGSGKLAQAIVLVDGSAGSHRGATVDLGSGKLAMPVADTALGVGVHAGSVVNFGATSISRAVAPVAAGASVHKGSLVDFGDGRTAQAAVLVSSLATGQLAVPVVRLNEAGGTFSTTPSQLTSTVGWYRASSIPGLASSDPVPTWSDLSSAANHAAQGTASKRPTWIGGIAAINGHAAVRFDATDDYLGFAAWASGNPLAQPVTISCVFKSSVGTRLIVDSDAWTLNNRLALFTESGNFLQFGFTLSLSVAYATGPYTVVNAIFNGASSSFYLDGVLKASGALDTGGMYGLVLGNEAGKAFPLSGDLVEVAIQGAAQSATERSLLNKYFASQYALTVA